MTSGVKELLAACREGDITKATELMKTHNITLTTTSDYDECGLEIICYSGNVSFLKHMLDTGFVLDATNAQHVSSYFAAISAQSEELVRMFTEAGFSVSLRNKNNRTPILVAAYNNDMSMLEYFLTHGVGVEDIEIDAVDDSGNTALLVFVNMDNVQAAEILLKKGANVDYFNEYYNSCALFTACCQVQPGDAHSDMLDLLLKYNVRLCVDRETVPHPLQIVTEMGNTYYVDLFLSRSDGIDIKFTSPVENLTLLHIAAANVHVPLVKLYVELGIEVDAKASNGYTPLMMALAETHPDASAVAHYLMDKGASLDTTLPDGTTLAHFAAKGNHSDIVRMCFEKGYVTATTKNVLNETLAHYAASSNALDVMKVLKEYNVDLNTTTFDDNFTPLQLALYCEHADMVKYLIENGANPFEPLHLLTTLAEEGDVDLLRLLVEAGVDVNVPDVQGKTVLQCDAIQQDPELLELITSKVK